MIKRILLFILTIFVITSCYRLKGPKKPKNLIPQDKMVNILMDIRLMSSSTGKNQKTLNTYGIKSEAYIFNKYKIDSLQFVLSNEYYAYNVDAYEDIYAKVKDSLEGLKKFYQELQEKEAEEKRIQDSLDAIKKVKKPFVDKELDSIRLIKIRDSIKGIKNLDTLNRALLEKKIKKGLIAPVSDIQPQD